MPRKTRKKGSKNKVSIKPLSDLYKITLKSLGRIFKSEGLTFEEAIKKIKISGGARMTSVITIEKAGVVKEKILNARQTNGLFGQGSPTMQFIHLQGVRKILGI